MIDYAERQETLLRLFGTTHAYEDVEELFFIAPDRLGFGVIANPLAGADKNVMDSLNALLNLHFPTDTIMQFCLYASPDIEETLHAFNTSRLNTTDPFLKEIGAKRVEFLRELTQRPIGQVSGARLRSFRVVITVQVKHGTREPTAHEMDKLRELKQTFTSSLKSCGFAFQSLTAARYVRFMETVFNHAGDAAWRGFPWARDDKGELLCNQILDPNNAVHVEQNQLVLGEKTRVRILSPKRYPDRVYPGMAIRYVGDVMKGTKALHDPALITLNVIFPDHEKQRGKLSREFAWATRQVEGKLARFVPDFARKKKSMDIAMEAIEAGDRIVYAYISAATFSDSDEQAIQASMEIQSTFRELGFQMMEDQYFLLPMFAQMVPFGAEEVIRPILTRYRTLPTRHVVPMLPMLGSWRGTGQEEPLLTFFARDGQLMTFSPFVSDGNFNFIVAAQSGMGKSYLANNIVTNILTVGGRAWIIDKGYSYKKLCQAQGGQYIEFTPDSDICLNPFTIVQNFKEEADILSSLISLMAAPNEGLTDFQLSIVKSVLSNQWDIHGNDLLVDHLAEAFIALGDQEGDKRIRDIGIQLFSFTSKGEYGSYFNGRNNIDMDNSVVVLELQQLSGRRHLQRLVLLQLMYQIQHGMDNAPLAQKKFLLIDEAWDLLATDETEAFIVGWYRQLRKSGASAGICTQSINDFFQNSGSLAIIENSAHKLLLGQKKESIAAVKKEERLKMSDYELALLESVHTVPGEYSEILISNAFGVGVGRLVESPFNNLLYSSHHADRSAIDVYIQQGCNQVEAINRVLADRAGAKGRAA